MDCISNVFVRNGKLLSNKEFRSEYSKGNKLVYEVLRVIDGVPLFLEKHYDRMNNSMKIINRKLKYSVSDFRDYMQNLIKEDNKKVGNIKITIDEEDNINVFFIKHFYPTSEYYTQGVHTILYFGERENPNAKIVNSSFRDKVNYEIEKSNAYEAILVDRNGFITEGSKSNIFMVRDNELITSPLEDVLPGVTRGSIMELCKKNNISFKEEKVSYKDLDKIQALVITGTSPKILPINSVNNIKYDSMNNEIVKKIVKIYDDEIESYVEKNKYIN